MTVCALNLFWITREKERKRRCRNQCRHKGPQKVHQHLTQGKHTRKREVRRNHVLPLRLEAQLGENMMLLQKPFTSKLPPTGDLSKPLSICQPDFGKTERKRWHNKSVMGGDQYTPEANGLQCDSTTFLTSLRTWLRCCLSTRKPSEIPHVLRQAKLTECMQAP